MIEHYFHRNKKIELYNRNNIFNESNIFSILVGKNGSGKSTLLGNITNDIIQEKKHVKKNKLFDDFHSSHRLPSEIITVSTSPFDKFPIDRFDRLNNYSYLGLRDLHSINFGIAYLAKIIASLIESVLIDERQAYEIGRVLNYLGYQDEIWANFQMTNSRRVLEDIIELEDPSEIFISKRPSINRRFNKSFFLNKDESISQKKLMKLRKIAFKVIENNSFRSNFEVLITKYGLNIDERESEDILFLIQAGILRLRDVKLRSLKDNSNFSIKNASSGEQSIILSILGIASKIQDRSLICIDEPEICLHPQWQEKYIEILTNTFDHYKNCQFIIATHSPQIISRLSSQNSFIVDMEDNWTKNAREFINHSADYQLANIFDSPGYKNEYLSRIALNIFTKVGKNKKFDLDDLNKYNIIEKQSDYLKQNDPVYDLFLTLKEMKKVYG